MREIYVYLFEDHEAKISYVCQTYNLRNWRCCLLGHANKAKDPGPLYLYVRAHGRPPESSFTLLGSSTDPAVAASLCRSHVLEQRSRGDGYTCLNKRANAWIKPATEKTKQLTSSVHRLVGKEHHAAIGDAVAALVKVGVTKIAANTLLAQRFKVSPKTIYGIVADTRTDLVKRRGTK
jgi:hypothetical protein